MASPVDIESMLQINFWANKGEPGLMSVRFLDISSQIIGEAWFTSPILETTPSAQIAEIINVIVDTARETVPGHAPRDVFVGAALCLVSEACTLSGIVEVPKPSWAADIAVIKEGEH